MSFFYQFPAVKGKQAGRDYYIAMLPLKLLSKIFTASDEESLPPEFRAQRKLNELRIPEIKEYILNNKNNYVFSALSATISGDFDFKTFSEEDSLGIITVPMESHFLINDGQHRKAAIEAALKEDDTIGDETISVVFFKDEGIERSQQMFTDLNKHAVKSSKSLSTLYDNRNTLATATKNIISNIDFFRKYTDLEKDNLGKNSSNLFTLANFYHANKKILKTEDCSNKDEIFLKTYWTSVSDNIVEWNELARKEITKKDLRENYILTLGITILAFGKLGNYFYQNKSISFEEKLKGLKQIDWSRSCTSNWANRTIRSDGKIINNENAIVLTCSKIKRLLEIELSPEELIKERSINK